MIQRMRHDLPAAVDAARPYLAEAGRAGFAASAVVLLVGVAMDHWRPGSFFSYVAPQHLVGAVLAFGALSLSARPARRPGRVAVLSLMLGAALAIAVYWAASRYFAPLGDTGARLSAAAAFAVGLPFALFRRFGDGSDREA